MKYKVKYFRINPFSFTLEILYNTTELKTEEDYNILKENNTKMDLLISEFLQAHKNWSVFDNNTKELNK